MQGTLGIDGEVMEGKDLVEDHPLVVDLPCVSAINTNLLCFTSRFVFLDRHYPASYTQAQQYSIIFTSQKMITPDRPAPVIQGA